MADEIKLKAPTVEQQVVVNISGEDKLEKFADTLDKISKGRGLQKYWKDQQTLINDTIKAYNNFNKSTSQTDATELIKTTNALKAMAGVDISTLIPDFDKFTSALSKAEGIAGHLTDAFTEKAFRDAFSSFETLKAYGLDIEKFFSHFELDANTQNLQKSLRLAEKEIQRVKAELTEKDIKLDSLINGSGFAELQIQLENANNELDVLKSNATEVFKQFLRSNGFDDYFTSFKDDELFRPYIEEIEKGYITSTQAITQFKLANRDLLQDFNKNTENGFNTEQLNLFLNKLEEIFKQTQAISENINNIMTNGVMTKAMQNLSVDNSISQSQRDLFANVLKDEEALSSIASVLKKIIDESVTLQGVNNKIFDEEQFNRLLILFEKIESSLSSMKAVFVDVGDGEEFSPLLKMIDNVQSSIKELSTSVKGIGLNMNIDVGSDSEMEAKVQSKISNALQAYQRLFDHIKMSGAGGSMINTNFFEFDINQYDTMMAKLQAYKKFIENMRKEAKAQFNGNDVLYNKTDKSYWSSASAAMGQVTKAFNEMNTSADTSPLENLFGGKTDLTEVVSQLNLIVDKLGEISTTASEFKNVFANGFNVSASVEEIEKLTGRVKELEDELSKVKVGSTTAPIKDTFQGGKIEQATTSAKELDKTLEQAVDVSTDDFDEILSKLDLTKSKLGEIVKITKQTHIDADGKPIESYTLKDKYGSTEIYGESSNPQLLRSNIVEYDAKQKAKEETVALKEKAEAWNKNIKAIQEYMDANTKLNNLKAQDAGTGKKVSEIAYQTKEVEKLEKIALEAKATLFSMINPHEAPIDDWNKWLEMMKQFDQATEGSARSVARLEDALRNMAKSQSDKIGSVVDSNQAHLDKLRPTEGNRSVEFEDAVQEYNKAIIALKEFHATLDASTPLTKEQSAKYDELASSLQEARVEMEKFSAAEKGSTEGSRWKEIDKITKYLEKNTRISKIAKQQLEDLVNTLKNVSGVNVDNIHLQFNKIAEAERVAGREGKRFWDILTDKAVYGAAAQLAGYYLSLTDFIRYTQNGIQTIREFDTALTEMRKVSDETVSSLERFQDVSFDLADGVGTTAKAIQDATADWMRLGESLEEAKQSAQDANVLFRVSEFESIDEATESLVAMSAAYKDLEKSQINDVLNEIGNNYAISTDELASALQKSAATLSVAGNDIYEAAALVTAGNAVLQDANSVGTGLKMISLRILGTQEAKDELASLGEDVDDFVVQTKSKIDETVRNFTAVASNDFKGISVLDDNGNYRSTYEILRDISQVYQEILETDKKAGTNRGQALLEVLAGKNRSNVAASILQSPELLTSAYESAMKSAGSAQEELDKFLESIDGRMAKLENQAQEFWFKFIDSDTIKNGITLLTELLGLATDFVDTFGALGTATAIGGGILGAKNIGRPKMFGLVLKYADNHMCSLGY